MPRIGIAIIKTRASFGLSINDITREEEMKKAVHRRKLDSVEMAQKVIDKQMVVAQQIASLLGETTAETKVTLNKLKDLIDSEVD